MSLNKVMLIGSLDDKPQVREVEGGQKMVGLSVVTTRHGQDTEAGQKGEGREWHRVVIIDRGLAAFAEANLARNDQVYIEGQLHTECWQDETYQWRSLTKILLPEAGGQLRRLTPADALAEVNSSDGPMLAAAREAHLIETPSDEIWRAGAA